MDVDTLHVAHRFHELSAEAGREADYLMEHFHAGHVTAAAFDLVALLVSAAQLAERLGDLIMSEAGAGLDENQLDAADIYTEEITRLVTRIRPWREGLDTAHHIGRAL